MPGLSGIIGTPLFLKKNEKILDEMLSVQNKENFFLNGRYIDFDVGVQIAWKTFDVLSNNSIPVWNGRKDIALIFIGEDYQDSNHNYCCKPKDDNNNCLIYMINQYEKNGIGFLSKINGWFSGVLIDYRLKEVHLFNDWFGIQRIYYYHKDEVFYFSTEAKSLLKALPDLRSIDYVGLGEFFSLDCTLNNKTIFKNISIFPAGSVWTFSLGRIKKKNKAPIPFINSDEERHDKLWIYENLRAALPKIMSRYNRGQKIAVSLTGGLDTRLIMAWSDFPPYKVPCYTFSGIYRNCHDAKIGAKIASICQQDHKIIRIRRAFFSEFPALAKKVITYTDGTMDVSGTAELFVLREARDIAPIRLTGNYGDQILRGVVGFENKPLYPNIFDGEFLYFVNQGHETYNLLKAERYLEFFIAYQMPYYHYPRLALEQTQVLNRTPFLDKVLLKMFFSMKQGQCLNMDMTLRLIYEGDPRLARISTDRGMRYPYFPVITSLRKGIKEFTYKAEYAFDYGLPQRLAKLESYLRNLNIHKLFLGRQKYYHFRIWYKNELSGYIKEILLSPRSLSRPYLNRDQVIKIIESHLNGIGNYTREIHSLLTCELVHRYLLESI